MTSLNHIRLSISNIAAVKAIAMSLALMTCGPLQAQTNVNINGDRVIYTGVDACIPVITGASGSSGNGTGYSVGLTAGIKFTSLLSADVSAHIGHARFTPHKCCIASGFWLGTDGNRYLVPVAGLTGAHYAELESSVTLQQYRTQLNIDLLSLCHGQHKLKWTACVSPLIALVGSRASINSQHTDKEIVHAPTLWHFGGGLGINASRLIGSRWSIGVYSNIIWLTGHSTDGLPDDIHRNNVILNSGIMVRYALTSLTKVP